MNRENKLSQFIFITLIIVYGLISCNTTEPPDKAVLTFTLEDVSCTEAWITLTTNNLQLPATLNLIKDNTITKTINLQTADTLIYVDSLLPNQRYIFKVFSIKHPATSIRSNELSVTTLDTTSHNFTWQTFTFGDIGNSVLFDVAVISENNIWCVGEIRIADNSPSGYTTYNAIHWDGSQWELKRILYQGGFWVIRTIFAFSENDIWFSAFVRYDGQNFIELPIPPILVGWSINKIWGSSSNDLYVVGNNGNIARYLNGTWSRIESGTDVDLKDVWGTTDGKVVWVCGKNLNKSVLVKIENSQARIVFEDQPPWQVMPDKISGGLSSIWTHGKNFIYATTPVTVYRCLSNTNGEGKEIYPYDDYLYGGTVTIRGTGANNIITSGNNASVLHYNGVSWKRFEQLYDESTYLWSSDIRNGIIVSVGEKFEGIFDYKAVVIVGKK